MELATLKKMSASALFHFSLLLFTFSLFAAPAKNAADPVAEGYPAWTGITAKNRISGRTLVSGADLRQRVATIVVEFDAEKAAEQLEKTGMLASLNGFGALAGHGSTNWESIQIPRDVLVIYVAHNVKTHDAVVEGAKVKEAAKDPGRGALYSSRAPIYEGVTFAGAPDNGGKFPFVYVLGYEGTEALVKEAYGAKTRAAIDKAISEQRKKLSEAGLEWKPYYGYVAEPKHFKDIEKARAKGKPLDAAEAKLLKSVTSKNPEVAKEAQMLYDGLVQTRSDMIQLVQCSCGTSPHVAAYTMGQVLKSWPKVKKDLKAAEDKIKSNAGYQPIIKMYPKLMQWADPNFECKKPADAKKVLDELQKMKKTLEPIREDSKDINVQNSALMVDNMLDEVIAVISAKVPQK